MAFKGTDFYQFASDLYSAAKEEEEAKIRSIVSRAYYGAFLASRDKAGITSMSATVHAQTSQHYLNIGKSSVANRLDDLRTRRNNADYDTGIKIDKRKAGEALVYAKKILDDLGQA